MAQKTNKLKPLMPSLREKKRYIAFELISSENFKFMDVKNAIIFEYKKLFGDMGISKAGILMPENLYKNNKGIIRVSNKCVDKLRLSLAMVKKIDKKNVIIKSIITSGMIKKAKEKIESELKKV